MYTKEAKYGTNGRMFAEIYVDETPATLPATSDDVDDILDGYRFTTGSILYIVDTGKVYMYKVSTESWKEQ